MKTLRKAVLSLMVCLCLLSNLNSQTPGFDYYSIVTRQERYFDSLRRILPDTAKIQGWRSYERWKDFWSTRVYNDPNKRGSFSEYSTNLIAAYSNPAMQAISTSSFDWQLAGPLNIATHNKGIIVSLWIDPDNLDVIFAGSNTAGMFATSNGGTEWSNVTDNIGLPAIGVNDIVVDPTNKSIKYIAVSVSHHEHLSYNQPAYIYKTTDNCLTWAPILSFPASDNFNANRIIMDPSNSNILYALIKGRVYRTMNAGDNWEVIFDSLSIVPGFWNNNKQLLDIEFKPNDPNTLYISSSGIGPTQYPELTAELWTTANAGETEAEDVIWTKLTDGLTEPFIERIGLETDPHNPDILYFMYSVSIPNTNDAYTYIKKLTAPTYLHELIAQKRWNKNSYSAPFGGVGPYCMNIEISPINPDIVYIGGYNMDSLSISNPGLFGGIHVGSLPDSRFHVDQRVFKLVNSEGVLYLYSGNDGGVSR